MTKKGFAIPSIADILFIVTFVYLSFYGGQRLLIDCDTGYHIRAGEYIIESLSVPRHDIFSFISPPLPWTAHEWLSEVIMASVHRFSGLTGITLFFAFVIAFTSGFFFKVIKSYKKNIVISAFLVALVIGSTRVHWLARPHIFALLLTVIWYYLLDLYQYERRNYLYLLPLLMLLWVNLHGSFIIALTITGIYFSGNTVRSVFSEENEKELWCGKAKTIGLVLVICILISFVNPYGYGMLLFPFELMSSQFVMDNIGEFLSPNFHKLMPFTFVLYLMIMILAISKLRLNAIEALLMLIFTHMALYSVRFIPVFAVISAPIILKRTDKLVTESRIKFIEYLKFKSENIAAVDASAKGHMWSLIAILIVITFALNGRIAYSFDSKIKPVDAVKFLDREKLPGNMFNEREFGDYIIYALWPKYRVFADGRADVYGEERMKEYFKVIGIEPGWNEILNKYQINWIINNSNSPLSNLLLEREDWKMIYADEVANIFVRNTPENQYLIDKYSYVRQSAKKIRVD